MTFHHLSTTVAMLIALAVVMHLLTEVPQPASALKALPNKEKKDNKNTTNSKTMPTPIIDDATENLTVIASLFQLSSETDVCNAKVWVALLSGASFYAVKEAPSGNTLATTIGDTVDVYGLTGPTNIYVTAYSSDNLLIAKSATIELTPFTPSGEWMSYNNSAPSTIVEYFTKFQLGDIYYNYYQGGGTGGYPALFSETSTDGMHWGNSTMVLDSTEICSSTGGACKVERDQFMLNPTTNQIVFWGHFENAQNYNLGEVVCASGYMGENLTYHGAYRPLGHDSRDMTVYPDGPNAYMFSATDVNVNMNIYNLTANWTAVESLVETVNKNQYREAPAIIKNDDDYFFLFTSRAAGWYPSTAEYITAKDINNWSTTPYVFGNTATFCSQSGGITKLGPDYIMVPNRWSGNWNPPQTPDRNLALPIFTSGDRATTNYYPIVKYQDFTGAFGVQYGMVLSHDKPNVTASSGTDLPLAVAGTEDSKTLAYAPSSFPFWYEVDLEDQYQITMTALTTAMTQGSEAYYQYTITASADGAHYDTIENNLGNTNVGFSTNFTFANCSSKTYRYVRLNAQTAINTHNGHAYPYGAGVQLFEVYGWPSAGAPTGAKSAASVSSLVVLLATAAYVVLSAAVV